MRILYIGLGGFAGAILRYALSGLVQYGAPGSAFPWGTLAVNVCGCFVMGVISELIESRGFLTPDARAFLIVGVLGGFTTFSAFANETVSLLRDGAVLVSASNVVLNVAASVAAVYGGRWIAVAVWST